MISGGAGDWRSRGRRDAIPNPVSHTLPVVDEHIGRLDVLMDEAAPMNVAERCRQVDGEMQEVRQFEWFPLVSLENPIQGITTRVHRARGSSALRDE